MTDDDAATIASAVAVSLVAGAVILIVVGTLIIYAARKPFPTSIVSALTILATLALIGYAVGGEARPELAAIAGTAVGALAGATTSLLASRQHDEPDTFEEDDDA